MHASLFWHTVAIFLKYEAQFELIPLLFQLPLFLPLVEVENGLVIDLAP